MKLASAFFVSQAKAVFTPIPAVSATVSTPARLQAVFTLGTFGLPTSLTDTVSFSDAVVRALEKPASDLFALADSAALSPNKAISDVFALADSATFSTSKALAEGFSASDAATFQWDWTRPFASSAVFGDVANRTVSRPVYDTAKFSESVTYDLAFGKSVSDTVSLPTAGEAVYKVFTSKHTEAATFADTGSLRSQSYADATYFAEDYVGASRDF